MTNPVYRTLEWETSQGVMAIQEAIRPSEDVLEKYADWYKEMALFATGERVTLTHFSWQDLKVVFGDRKSTHSFPGCDNRVWVISPEDEAAIMAIETSRADAKNRAEDNMQAEKNAHIRDKLDQAVSTGRDQVLDTWMDDCDGSASDCSFDSVSKMIRPDGTTYTSRRHCH